MTGGAKATTTRAYWVKRAGAGELCTEEVSTRPARGRSLIEARFSGISPGTERLVGLGLVPPECADHMRCRYMAGDFALPIKYGYSFVGRAIAGELAGQRVFVMHPHQGLAEIADQDATMLPDDVPEPRATLIPNLETALNAAWDAELQVGERVAVVGAGPVGMLLTFVLDKLHDQKAVVLEADDTRREFAARLPWGHLGAESTEVDVAFHCSGTPAGLQSALDMVGFEGRVIDLSWYGDQRVSLNLGTDYHYLRKSIVASQVGTIAKSRRTTHGYKERLADVVELLRDPMLDQIVGSPVEFESLPMLMNNLYTGRFPNPVPVIAYA